MSNFIDIIPPNIDSTIMSTFRSCHRKGFNEFIRGLRHGKSLDLHAGGCFALGLETVRREVHLNSASLDDALLKAQMAFEISWGDFQVPPDKDTAKTPDRMWEAIVDYFHMYPPMTDHIQPFVANGQP